MAPRRRRKAHGLVAPDENWVAGMHDDTSAVVTVSVSVLVSRFSKKLKKPIDARKRWLASNGADAGVGCRRRGSRRWPY